MALVPAICTQCGAQLEVDNSHEAAICKYCGTPFIVEKAINNYHTNMTTINNINAKVVNVVNGNVDNFLQLASFALKSKNISEAIDYIQKVLEIDINNAEAWRLKLEVAHKKYNFSDTFDNINEMISCADKFVKCSPESKRERIYNELYYFFIFEATMCMVTALNKARDIDSLIAEKNRSLTPGKFIEIGKKDILYQETLDKYIVKSIFLKRKIPENYIKYNNSIQDEIVNLYKQYINYGIAIAKRLKIFGWNMSQVQLDLRKDRLNIIKSGLPNDIADNLPVDSLKAENGCYIATCVYGSYDCPEVWTLRRFRDYTLDETWYGKAFIKCYYAISPTLVKWFGSQQWFRIFWKNHLDKMVDSLNKKGIANTKYKDKY